MPLKECSVIRIYVPLEMEEMSDGLAQSQGTLLSRSPYLSKILDILATSEEVGRLGNYCSVYELVDGEEWYTPTQSAHPSLGRPEVESGVRIAVVTTYAVGVSRPQIEEFLEKVVNAHPWEHPVIEYFSSEGSLVWFPH
jgi:hypothetical protein